MVYQKGKVQESLRKEMINCDQAHIHSICA